MGTRKLVATCHGRAMMTTELIEPNLDDEKVVSSLPIALKPNQKVFKQYVHIIPDRQHQIFKLVEQI